MFWGQQVDLNAPKGRWAIAMEVALALTLLATAIVMAMPAFFVLSVAAMFLIATLSATHDIACDGLYLMSLDKKRQAAFSGVMATCSRLGRLFAASLLVAFAGYVSTRGIAGQSAWAAALGLASLIYGAGMLWTLFALPRPAADTAVVDVAPGERSRNVVRTLTVIAFGVVLY